MQLKKLLVANRSEIAIRVLRAASELGLRTVAIYSKEDQLALHRFKADESYLVGEGLGPVTAYLAIDNIIRIAQEANVDAIHPGYGFLSENPDFAEACAAAGIVFIGPSPETMRTLGDKVSARNLAQKSGVPVLPATKPLPQNESDIHALAKEVGFPMMLKASWGGGGRGMRLIEDDSQLISQVAAGRSEAASAFGKDEVYLEKFLPRARHIEVQILGDTHGQVVHLYERDCSIQRRNQKVVERAPAPYLDVETQSALCKSAVKLALTANYVGAGTVEFLMDSDTGKYYFIEVNPRIQVEHTVTEEVTGVDLIKGQIRVVTGAKIGNPESGVPSQENIHLSGHALQCRITTENPENNFIPDYGRITAYRGATGFGIRLDGGTAYSGAVVTRYYDSLLEKVTAWAPNEQEVLDRMTRALREFRIRGVATNLAFLENLINHPDFRAGRYTTRFIDQTPDLFNIPVKRDRATRLLRYIAHVTVNGNAEVKGRPLPLAVPNPVVPEFPSGKPPSGTRDKLQALGARKFSEWMKAEQRILITDTTMRDAHQSLIATRMRTSDMRAIAPAYAHNMSQLFSVECWGGATFDVAMRYLKECPWERLADLRTAMPNILTQMLLRASNAVGYTNYPDNVVRYFVKQTASAGMDVFRVFDSLNWVENMRVAIDAVCETDALCEAAICYTGDILDPKRQKYSLSYYVGMAQELEAAGAHILGIKDMAGVLKPAAARQLVSALKDATSLPIHLHTHDTSGIGAATVLAAIEAGIDAVDGAIDSLSGLTSQPNLGSIVEALKHTDKDPGLDPEAIRSISNYWELVRHQYRAFESDIRSGASEVYLHEMPGGQYTNLKEQARALGLESRWHEVAKAYADVNILFGDIVKVTPSSKVVGDMALMMVSSGLSSEDVINPEKEVSFPDSVISLFRGEIGQPPGGFPKQLQKKVLKGETPLNSRPGESIPSANLEEERRAAEAKVNRKISDEEFASYLMYPKVFSDFAAARRTYGPTSCLPTPVYFYGMAVGEEVAVDIEQGKTLNIRCLAIGEPQDDATVEVFFELNGQPRTVRINDESRASLKHERQKADPENPGHVSAPFPGMISTIAIKTGQLISAGDTLLTLEAMKMESSISTDVSGKVIKLNIQPGDTVDAKDLLVEIEPR